MKLLIYVTAITSSIFLISCLSIGINFKNKTPKKSAKLPKFTIKDSLIGYNNDNRSNYDVTHYDIHLSFYMDKKTISGCVTTSFKLFKKSGKIQLDLDEQFVIDSIKQKNQQLLYIRNYTAIIIQLNSNETEQAVTVYYHGKPKIAKSPPWEGGFVWKKDKNGNPFVAVACEGDGAKTWLPIKTYLGDKPDSITTEFIVPTNLTVISNGNLVNVVKQYSSSTYVWKTSYLINPYNITFYIGDYKLIEEPYTCLNGENMNLKFYVLSYNYEKAKKHFEQVSSILTVFEELFGKYPWIKDGYKLVESPFAGMEHQTAIAYGNGYKNELNENYDHIILHETAHEWWGNSVSVSDFSDVWIHEGIATYAEALYVEKTKGYQAYLDYIDWTSIMVMNKKPVVGPAGLYYWNYKDGDVYNKGSVMLHTLRNHINNDSLFFLIIKNFYKTYSFKMTTTSDFIKLVNEITHQDLTYFFNQYLYSRNSPLLKWHYGVINNHDVIIYKFERVNDDFSTIIEVKQGDDVFYIRPQINAQYTTLPHSSHQELYMNSKSSYVQDFFEKIE